MIECTERARLEGHNEPVRRVVSEGEKPIYGVRVQRTILGVFPPPYVGVGCQSVGTERRLGLKLNIDGKRKGRHRSSTTTGNPLTTAMVRHVQQNDSSVYDTLNSRVIKNLSSRI